MDLVNRIKQTSLNLAEALTPVLKDSKFKESGRLNPEEFVCDSKFSLLLSNNFFNIRLQQVITLFILVQRGIGVQEMRESSKIIYLRKSNFL